MRIFIKTYDFDCPRATTVYIYLFMQKIKAPRQKKRSTILKKKKKLCNCGRNFYRIKKKQMAVVVCGVLKRLFFIK